MVQNDTGLIIFLNENLNQKLLDEINLNLRSISKPNKNKDLKRIAELIRFNLTEIGYRFFATGGFFLDIITFKDKQFLRIKLSLKEVRLDLNTNEDLYMVEKPIHELNIDCIQCFVSGNFQNLIFWKSLDKDDTSKDKHDA